MIDRVPLTLFANVTNVTVSGTWDDPYNTSDPWIGYPYQWTVTVNIQSQAHSDPTTPRPYTYNGLDVKISDWLVFASTGMAVEVISITSQSDSVITFIVEDVNLHNLLNNAAQSGQGIGPVSAPGSYDCLLINLNASGVPIFAAMPDYAVPINLIADITNRFQFRNYVQDFIIEYQNGHSFDIGQVIYLDSSGIFHKSISTQIGALNTVGTITSINQPNIGNFTFRPAGRYVKNLPTLPGSPGQLLYVSDNTPGGLTSSKPSDAIPVYIKITNTSAILTSGLGGSSAGGTGNIIISGNTISAANADGNIILQPRGNGVVHITGILDAGGNRIIHVATPTQPTDVANKSYVDAVASGLSAKEATMVATDASLDATFSASFGYGSLTGNVYQHLTIDDISLSDDDRVLVKNQIDETQNGIYSVIQAGGVSQPWILIRSLDFNGQGTAGTIKSGDFVFVELGNTNGATGWVMTSPNPISINVSNIHWTQFSAAGVIQAGFGLTKTGTILDVNVAQTINTVTALNTSIGPDGKNIIEIRLSNNTPLEFNNGQLRVNDTIAGQGLSYNLSSGILNVSNNLSHVTSLGNIAVGSWSASSIGYQYGGTGLTILGNPAQSLVVNGLGTALEYANRVKMTEATVPPTVALDGDKWFNTDTGILFTRISDSNGNHWVEL